MLVFWFSVFLVVNIFFFLFRVKLVVFVINFIWSDLFGVIEVSEIFLILIFLGLFFVMLKLCMCCEYFMVIFNLVFLCWGMWLLFLILMFIVNDGVNKYYNLIWINIFFVLLMLNYLVRFLMLLLWLFMCMFLML